MKAISLLVLLFACASHQEKQIDQIREGLLSKYNQYHQCYFESDTFMNKKDVQLKYMFTILEDGSTIDHKILEQTQKDPNFSTCFLMVMKELKFKRPLSKTYDDGNGNKIVDKGFDRIEVKQPFNFVPGSKK